MGGQRARTGLGRRMVSWFLDNPDYADIRRFMLATKDAHGVYARLGFTRWCGRTG